MKHMQIKIKRYSRICKAIAKVNHAEQNIEEARNFSVHDDFNDDPLAKVLDMLAAVDNNMMQEKNDLRAEIKSWPESNTLTKWINAQEVSL